MKKIRPNCLILFALCVMLVGCGGDEADTRTTPESSEPEQGPVQAEILIEASEPKLTKVGQEVDAMSVVDSIVTDSRQFIAAGYHAQFDREFIREGQRLIVVSPMHPVTPDQADTNQAANETFAALKTEFDAYTKQALADELAHQQSVADTSAKEVKQLQQSLQIFQEARRGLPATDASRLERRKLDRQIETTLQQQIDANKRVQELQRRIDREKFVTLLRVR